MTALIDFPDNLPAGWTTRLSGESQKSYFLGLRDFLESEEASRAVIFPEVSLQLRALQSLDFDEVRVVVLGQDPYHGPGQAMGLSFAVPNELRVKPPSLTNIFKEIQTDLDVKLDFERSDLSGWVQQGVLLLNTVLSVRAGEAFSHRKRGWEQFTDKILTELSLRESPLVFVLWGAAAQKKKALIDSRGHLILESVHPSPLAAHRGFFGSRPFSRVNAWLKAQGQEPIDWVRTSLG